MQIDILISIFFKKVWRLNKCSSFKKREFSGHFHIVQALQGYMSYCWAFPQISRIAAEVLAGSVEIEDWPHSCHPDF